MSEYETGYKWWIRHVIIPVGGGLCAAAALLIAAMINNASHSETSKLPEKVIQPAVLSFAALEKEAIEQTAKVEQLRQKSPPFGYTFAKDCATSWTNVQGRRIWVRDAKGLSCGETCPWEPLGVYIPEDKDHYYDGGIVKAFSPEQSLPPIPPGCFPHLDGACAASVLAARIGESITFKVVPEGGNGEYVYTWEGGEGESFERPEVVTSYSTPGKKSMSVRITSNGEFFYCTCTVIIRAN
jgi:hypothetical protein